MNWQNTLQENIPYVLKELEPILVRVREKKNVLDAKRPLSVMALNRIKHELNLEWSYNSNAIEGNTLTLNETRLVLEDGLTIKGKSFIEHLEISNHHDAIEFVEKMVKLGVGFTQTELRSVHQLVMQKIDKEFAGVYRSGAVRITGANFTPPQAFMIPELISDYVAFILENPLQLAPEILAAIIHHRLVWIHPFFDGNGRTARLFTNLYLMNSGFPPAIILKNDRKKYYEALNQANNGNFSKIVLLHLQAIERSLDLYLSTHPGNPEAYKPISDIVEEPSISYNQEYVSLLARQGKIDAYKEGNVWFTTQHAVEYYVANRKRKR